MEMWQTVYGLVDLDRLGTRMKIIFVRHGEPDYSMLDKLENPRLYSGFGRDLAPLTGKGRSLAKEVAKTACFGKAEIYYFIVCDEGFRNSTLYSG